jgi:Ribonuclease G/E
MKGRTIVLDEIGGRAAAALMVDGRLDDILIDVPEDMLRAGAILRGIAQRPMKGMGGVFVDLGEGRTGFLRQTKGIAPGKPLLVQVAGFARGEKAVPVTTRLMIKGRFAIGTPGAPGRNVSRSIDDADRRAALEAIGAGVDLPDDVGLILRSAAADAPDAAVAEDVEAIAAVTRAILADAAGGRAELLLDGPDPHEVALAEWTPADEVAEGPGSFAAQGVMEALEALRQPRVSLPGGAWMTVEATEALVAVDVNTGPDTSPAAALKANIAAARALPRELRCRGLGGAVTVDFAPFPRADRHRVEQSLKAVFRGDRDETVLAGWTPIGHFELQRKRARLPLAELLP